MSKSGGHLKLGEMLTAILFAHDSDRNKASDETIVKVGETGIQVLNEAGTKAYEIPIAK
jgi:hypothetical protein